MKVFGPYTREDGRQHVVLQDSPGGKLKTVSYPKYLMEQQLGRELDPDKETIDHIDDDFTNNDPKNLRIVTRVQNASEGVLRTKLVDIPCVRCGTMLQRRPAVLRERHSKGIAGPFCSRVCSGKYGTDVQNGGDKLPPQPSVKSEYYKKPKVL